MDDKPCVYLVYVDSDLTEGRGQYRLKHVFADDALAAGWIEAQPDPWNRNDREWRTHREGEYHFGHMFYTRQELITYDLAETEARQHELVVTALSKLGSEEIRALGLEHLVKR